ncbi:MAG: hypothetical protein EOO07_14515 [Chitinophagaceae bacterium]|nr:MAG: hypothetical protein EOO07_14515 [Chitinophagaceae bacterium]
MHYFVWLVNGQVCMRKRQHGDIWEGLYDFPSYEGEITVVGGKNLPQLASEALGQDRVTLSLVSAKKHVLTHQVLELSFYLVEVHKNGKGPDGGLEFIALDKLAEIPMPIVIHNFMAEILRQEI